MTISIYTLSDPITNEVKYIGKTSMSLKERLRCHLKDKGINKRINWIKSLNKKLLIPNIELLDECLDSDSEIMEIYWINQFKVWGFDLKNMTNGGDGGILSIETKNKISIANSKLSNENVMEMIKMNRSGKYTQKEIGEFFGVDRKTISNRLVKLGEKINRNNKPLNEAQWSGLRKGMALPMHEKTKELGRIGRMKRFEKLRKEKLIPLPSKENF